MITFLEIRKMNEKVKRIRIGDKEYSLNDIWRLCRKMWADIKDESNIDDAKKEWLKKHGFSGVKAYCFFCTWAATHRNISNFCAVCPGKMVNSRFDCVHETYHYYYKPQKFEAKIRALDLKRVH